MNVPVSPTIVFESIPPSVIPTQQTRPRTTCVLSSVRSLQEDEMKQFEETDKISHKDSFGNI